MDIQINIARDDFFVPSGSTDDWGSSIVFSPESEQVYSYQHLGPGTPMEVWEGRALRVRVPDCCDGEALSQALRSPQWQQTLRDGDIRDEALSQALMSLAESLPRLVDYEWVVEFCGVQRWDDLARLLFEDCEGDTPEQTRHNINDAVEAAEQMMLVDYDLKVKGGLRKDIETILSNTLHDWEWHEDVAPPPGYLAAAEALGVEVPTDLLS